MPTITPGLTPNWTATTIPSQQGNPAHLGYDLAPNAHWSPHCVNLSTYSATRTVGVNAVHPCYENAGGLGIEKVEFIANGGEVATVTYPSINPSNGLWEWWADLASPEEDGPVEIRAIVYPISGVPKVLQGGYTTAVSGNVYLPNSGQSMVFYGNPLGTYDEIVRYVSNSGNDANDGLTPATAKQYIVSAAYAEYPCNNVTIRLLAGTYTAPAFTFDTYPSQNGYLKIEPAPGVARGDVIIQGRDHGASGYTYFGLMWLKNLTIDMATTNIKPINGAASDKHTCLVMEGTDVVGDSIFTFSHPIAGAVQSSNLINSAEYRARASDGYQMLSGFNSMSGVDIYRATDDLLSTVSHARDFRYFDCVSDTANALGLPGKGTHSDVWQAFGDPFGSQLFMDGFVYGAIQYQGIFGDDVANCSNIGFINVGIESDGIQGEYRGGAGLVLLHCSIAQGTLIKTNTPGDSMITAVGCSLRGNIFDQVSSDGNVTQPDAELAWAGEVVWKHNHYINASWQPGTNNTAGAINYADPVNYDYHPDELTPTVPRTVLWDMNQQARQPTTSNGPLMSIAEQLPAPTFSLKDGRICAAGQTLTLSVGVGDIYFTTGGITDPDDTDTLYESPISLTTTTTVKAINYTGSGTSAVVSRTYPVITDGTPPPPRITT